MTSSSVLEAILARARSNPERPTVDDLDRQLSYASLAHEAGVVAAALVRRGVRPGDRVALLLPNSVDFVVSALACLWAGAVFVPLAVSDPVARLAVILRDCDPALILTAEGGAAEAAKVPVTDLAHLELAHLELAGLREQPDPEPPPLYDEGAPPDRRSPAEDPPAYAIYTSGTTGTPKGVLIGNAAFANAVGATVAALELDGATRSLCVSPVNFDGSFGTVFPTLVAGGALVIPPRDAFLYPRTFFNTVAREGITCTGFSPSYLRLLLSSKRIGTLAGTALRVVALGGEASSAPDVRALQQAAPAVRIYNRYGPTETTIAVTHTELTPRAIAAGAVPIGRPHPGVTFHIVDEQGQTVDDPGRVGELFIGGNQLMLGYWRAPRLTARVMRTDVVPGATVYRTGDLVYRDERGDLIYVDRADRVIKRNGVRISLVEVTEVVRYLPGVAAATCVAFDDDGRLGIAAFVVSEVPTTALELQLAARRHLPANMLPDRFELVPSLPLNASSKVDEGALLAAAGLQSLASAAGPPPPPLTPSWPAGGGPGDRALAAHSR